MMYRNMFHNISISRDLFDQSQNRMYKQSDEHIFRYCAVQINSLHITSF